MSPWGLFFAYRICVARTESAQDTANSSEEVKSIKEAFLDIIARWNVAGTCLVSAQPSARSVC